MKRAASLLLAFVLLLSLCACKSKEVKEVEKAITDIGTVTADSGEAIQFAEELFNALSEEDKANVGNYDFLTTAKADLPIRIVETTIENIGTVSLDSESAISAAEEALSALSQDEQANVSNVEILTKAREQYTNLVYQQEAEEIDSVINRLGNITIESKKSVEDARKQ